MCGRFVSSSPPDEIARYFDVDRTPEQALEHRPNYNMAPTTDVFVVLRRRRPPAGSTPFHWGLVPAWAKDPSIGEPDDQRPGRDGGRPRTRSSAPFAKRRCIIPADGFYEWKAVPGQKRKQPYFIHRPDGEPYAFAGLWERWRGPRTRPSAEDGTGEEARCGPCTIITGAANEPMSAHPRPHAGDPAARRRGTRGSTRTMHDIEQLGQLLVPAPPELITMHPVSTEVNNVRNKGEHLVDEVDPVAEDGRLL